MTRNDGGTPRGDLSRASVTADDNAINPGDYWRRASDQPDNYQFTGDGKKVVTAANDGTQKTVTVGEKDSLWTIASRLVKESDCTDKSDKFKLDVVKGLVEKNKDKYKTLEANPDKIKGGWVLNVDSVEELAKLGHGKKLNTHYKPPSEREKGSDGTSNPPNKDCPPGHHKHHHGGRRADNGDQYGNPQYGDQYTGQRPMDMGPAKDIMGMIGMVAGSAILGNVLGGNRHHHRPYYDDYGYRGGYYDGGSGYFDGGYPYGNQFQQYRYPNYSQYRQQPFQNFQPPVNYSHYGRPQQGYVVPISQVQNTQFRIPQIPQIQQQHHHHNWQQTVQQQQRQQQWQQYHRHT